MLYRIYNTFVQYDGSPEELLPVLYNLWLGHDHPEGLRGMRLSTYTIIGKDLALQPDQR